MDQRGGIDLTQAKCRSFRTCWLDVGQVVYHWTDHREAAVDKVWWCKQRDVYGVMLHAANARTSHVRTIKERLLACR